jgi:O-antigen/teichoic acid export membrane protein
VATPVPESVTSDVLAGPDVRDRVVQGGVQRTIGFAGVNLITAAAAVLLLRHLGVADFGRYGTVIALLTIVQGVSDAGLTLTGSREMSMRPTVAERRELLAHLLALRIILSAVGIMFAVAFAVVAGYTSTMVVGTAVAGAGVFILSVQGALLLPLTVELQNLKLAFNDVLRQLVLAGCFVVLSLAGASLLSFFAAQLVAALVVLLITPFMLRRDDLVRPRWVASELRILGTTTLPLAIVGTLTVIYFRLLVIMMSVIEPSALQVGYYVTSERVIEIFLGLPMMLVGVVLPVLSISSRDDTPRLRYVSFRMTQTMALIGVLLAVILGTGARPIMLVLGGKQYLDAANVLRIQGLALITVFITAAWTTTLIGMGRTRALVICSAIGVGAVGLFGTAFIPLWHAHGAAIAAVIADVVFCGSMYVSMRRAGAARAFAAGPFVRIAFCALPGVAIALVSPLPDAINCVVATLLYIVLIALAGALPPELSDRIRSLLHLLGRRGDPGGTTTDPPAEHP